MDWIRRGSPLVARARGLLEIWPLRARGAWVAALSALFLWSYGYGALDLVVFVLGASGLALVALCLAVSGATALVLRRRERATATSALRFSAGVPVPTGFSLPAFPRLPLVSPSWEVLEPGHVEAQTALEGERWSERLLAQRRCQSGGITRRLRVECVFGLVRIRWREFASTSLTVFPDPGRLRQLPLAHSLASGDGTPHPRGGPEGDRMEIRPFVPGDSARDILWKKYARTGQLSIRQREASVERAQRIVAYLITGPGDEPSAAAARVALETGALGPDWSFGIDGSPEPVSSVDEALVRIARSGSIRPPGCGLGSFLAGLDAFHHCVVFAPSRAGAWLDGIDAASRGHPGVLSFVIGVDGVCQEETTSLWQRALFVPEPSRLETPAGQIGALVRRLAARGSAVIVADRVSGQCREYSGTRLGAVA